MTPAPASEGAPVALPEPTTARPEPGQLTFTAPRRGKPPRHLADLTPAERKEAVESLGHKGFRAKQLSTHYFERLEDDPEQMTDLPKAVRVRARRRPAADPADADRAARRRRRPDDEVRVAPARRRHRRVGAHALPQPRHDLHLEPGRLRHELPVLRDRPGRAHPQHVGRRDRRAGRLGGPRAAARRAGRGGDEDREAPLRVSNVVFMGMGEALANYKASIGAIRRLTDPAPDGLGMSARGITMSTVGLVPGIDKLAAEGIPVTLALSLHAPDDELRNELVPINTRWSVDEALDAAYRYFEATGRRVSIEYALIRDINDQGWRADLLGEKLNARGRGWVHVNPIPLNPTPGSKWTASRARRRAEVRRAAPGARHPDDDPRHPRPGHRRRLRPARRVDRLTRHEGRPSRPRTGGHRHALGDRLLSRSSGGPR